MAQHFVNSSSGSNSNGGTSNADAWLDIAFAIADSGVVAGDTILFAGTAVDSSFDFSSAKVTLAAKRLSLLLNTAVQSTKYQVKLVHTSTSIRTLEFIQPVNMYGIEWICNATVSYAQPFMEFDTSGPNSFIDCKWTADFSSATAEARFLYGTSSTRDYGFSFFDCEFDSSQTACYLALLKAPLFDGCLFYGHKNAGTGATDSYFRTAIGDFPVFKRCQFFDMDSRNLFYVGSDEYNSSFPRLINCTIYYKSGLSNPVYVFGGIAPASGDNTNVIFNSCIIENDTGNTITLFEDAHGGTKTTGSLVGANVWRNITDVTDEYDPNSAFSDTTSTSTNFESIVEGNADFLKLKSGADAIDHAVDENFDAGWWQSPGSGGAPNYPDETDVRKNVNFGAALVGSAYIPTAANVRFGIDVDATTGLAYIPAATNVRFGTNVDQTTGLAYIPTAANTRFGINVDATTGLAYIPAATNVRFGTNVDQTTGLAYIPTAANTRFGINVDATTGLAYIPTAANTLNGVNVDQTTGIFVPPANDSEVKIGVAWGVSGGDTGTYVAAERYSDPLVANVKIAIEYQFNSEINNRTGLLSGGGSTYVPPISTPGADGDRVIYDPREGV